jgi:hypothetical protein
LSAGNSDNRRFIGVSRRGLNSFEPSKWPIMCFARIKKPKKLPALFEAAVHQQLIYPTIEEQVRGYVRIMFEHQYLGQVPL